MASRKLEKIARQYRIDPSTLPPVDGESLTVNIAQRSEQPAVYTMPTREAQQSEYERLQQEFRQAKQRLQDYINQVRQERQAARRA